ncbi:MAG: transposase [Thiohalomonas sp.]|nr:transposase [Thiohalomonas sp.]
MSQEYGLSRPTLYPVQENTAEILFQHFSQTQEQLKARTITVDQVQLEPTIIALSIMAPNSIRAIEDLIPIIYPGLTRSFGSIQSLLIEGQEKARQFNNTVDFSLIKVAAVDEMYSQSSPVLAGVDLDSGFLHSLELCESRSTEDWEMVLKRAKSQGLNLDIVVKDAAPGIACGVKQVFPDAQQRDDCFHVLYDMNKVRRKIKSHGYSDFGVNKRRVKRFLKLIKKQIKSSKNE